MILKRAERVWYNAFFKPQSALPIALFRICLGILIIVNCALTMPDVLTWFGTRGWVQVHLGPDARFDLFSILPATDTTVLAVFSLLLVSGIMLCFGFASRAAAFVAWLALLSLQNWNPFVCNGGDGLMRIYAYFLMFSPCGEELALDRRLRQWLARVRGKGEAAATPEPREFAPWAQRLIQLQIACLYFQAFWGKLPGETWTHGTALYYVFHLHQYVKVPLSVIFDHIWISKIFSWGTLALEFCLWTLVWFKPFRYWVLACGVLLHLAIDFTMNIPVFEYLMIAGYLLFIDPEDLQLVIGCAKARIRRPAQ